MQLNFGRGEHVETRRLRAFYTICTFFAVNNFSHIEHKGNPGESPTTNKELRAIKDAIAAQYKSFRDFFNDLLAEQRQAHPELVTA